ncbi:1,2-phenylacetyl-CoA epoxidase subunit B [Peribacillus cavernae]|uniref:1,2-phenylacetyl-CoA epoxidase subunit B n=1 Tax=Peribacillus cavernae TaxID=1674310 RepID=A0A3S0U7W0_9BACI|nr:1,2-phenylacetyl-CoA epoxidase subunit B [Peribacillus cavernae]MDQ0218095.1 phenylacetate-CoA oxygenase PaaH subunit [Peribacillus cavernae]RUQ32748.1 1,2-phenylacetyl-CoA epoxidase subunit B [Peribacillus cavernae]
MERTKEETIFEVFRMDKRGTPYTHVGSVVSGDPDIALLTAQECYGRREGCAAIWVVRRSNITMTTEEMEDEFTVSREKMYRLPGLRKKKRKKGDGNDSSESTG